MLGHWHYRGVVIDWFPSPVMTAQLHIELLLCSVFVLALL